MKKSIFLSVAGVLCAGGLTGALYSATPDAIKLVETAPLRFEPSAESGRFTARGARYLFQFSKNQAVLRSGERSISLEFAGSDPAARIEGQDELPSRTNLFLGSDPSRWRRGVVNYGKLRVAGVYQGIDLIYYGNGQQLEYDLRIAPGGDTRQIRLRLAGANAALDGEGDLIGELIQKRPVAYQIGRDGARIGVKARYRRNRDGSYGFQLGAYDRSRELVIDPVLKLSVYLSGSNQDVAYAVARDQVGFIYVAGTTNSSDFPLAGNVYQSTNGGNGDIFIARVDPNSSQLNYSTYYGGSSTETFGGMAITPQGSIYVTGSTESTNLPLTSTAYQTALGGTTTTNAFLVYLDAQQNLAYATYLGGATTDKGNGIALDSQARAWIIGSTQSSNFPVAASLQGALAGTQDMFITCIDPSQSGAKSLVYSSYLGGSGFDDGQAIAVAANGTLWISGGSFSYDIPTVNGFQANNHGTGDVYVAHIDPSMGSNGLLYATLLGGRNEEEAHKIVLDPAGPVIVSGYTVSPDFPVTGNAYQATYGGNTDAFISILDPSKAPSSQLVYSTYFGGAGGDSVFDMKRDPSGTLYLAGVTLSAGLPATPDALQSTYDGTMDAFILRLNPSRPGKSGLDYFSYLGSDGLQVAYGIDLDSSANAYIVGATSGPIFNALGGTAKPSASGNTDAFVAAFPVCGFGISPNSQQFPASGGTGTIAITAREQDCSWFAESGLNWVTISPPGGSNNGSVTITVAPNTTGAPRQGSITVAGASFAIGQDASTPAAQTPRSRIAEPRRP